VSKSLEEMELTKLRSLQSLIPSKYIQNNGIDMTENSKITEIMKIIIESWKDVGGSGMKYVNKDRCLNIILNTVFLALNDKFVYNDDKPSALKRIGLIKNMKENTWQWYRWRSKVISNEEMWRICIKFEDEMGEAGIKGQSITKAFDGNMFNEEIWTRYSVEQWFPEEKGADRFLFNGEENLSEMEMMKHWHKRKRKLKLKKRRKKPRKPPDKKEPWETLMAGKRIKKPPDKRKGLLDALYVITVMGKQSEVKVNTRKDSKLDSGNLEILIKTKNVLKSIVTVLWDADINRSNKSFRFVWKDIIFETAMIEIEKVIEWANNIYEVLFEIEVLVRWKRRKGISTSDEGDCRTISVARGW
jgi:hypothetical protein